MLHLLVMRRRAPLHLSRCGGPPVPTSERTTSVLRRSAPRVRIALRLVCVLVRGRHVMAHVSLLLLLLWRRRWWRGVGSLLVTSVRLARVLLWLLLLLRLLRLRLLLRR